MIKILALVLCLPLFAAPESAEMASRFKSLAEDGQAVVTQPAKLPWTVGEFLCIHRNEKDKALGCGVVSQSDAETALVKLDFSNDIPMQEGDRVVKPKATKQVVSTVLVPSRDVWLSSTGYARNLVRSAVLYDLDRWIFNVGIERAFTRNVLWGVKADFYDAANTNSVLDAYGLMLTRTFFTFPGFQGAGLTLGVGPYFLRSSSASSTAPEAVTWIAMGSVTWNFKLRSWLSLGLQFALRWIPRPSTAGFDMGTNYHPFRSALGLELSLML